MLLEIWRGDKETVSLFCGGQYGEEFISFDATKAPLHDIIKKSEKNLKKCSFDKNFWRGGKERRGGGSFWKGEEMERSRKIFLKERS